LQSYVAVPIIEMPSTQVFVGLDEGSVVPPTPAKRKPRFPWLLVGLALFAAIIALGGVIFYFKGNSSTVLVTVDVDTTDPALQFTLDNKPIDAEALKKPIEVTAGEHELIVRKKGEIVRRYVITATPGAEPKFTFEEKKPEPKPAPVVKPKEKVDDLARQRAAVEWMISIGAEPYVLAEDSQVHRVLTIQEIPAKFVLEGCIFINKPDLTEADLEKYLGPIQTIDNVTFATCPKLGKGLCKLIRQMPHVRRVNLNAMSGIDEADIRTLFTIPGLEKLTLSGNLLSSETLQQLNQARSLQSLWLSCHSIPLEVCLAISELTDLYELTLSEIPPNGITPEGVAQFAKMPILRTLSLSFSKQIKDGHLSSLDKFPKLEIVYLNGTDITDAGCAKLAAIAKLKELHIPDTAIGDRGLAVLATNRTLKILNLAGSAVTDPGLKALEGHATLEELFLERTAISDDGVRSLVTLPKLVHLVFECNGPKKVTDASVPLFAKMTQLKAIDINKTDITMEGAKAIKKALPNCQVVYNGQAIEPGGGTPPEK